MKTFTHDKDGRIVVDPKQMSQDGEAVRDLIYSRCKVIKGELAYNVNVGVALTTVKEMVDQSILETISTTTGVVRVTNIKSKIENSHYYAYTDILSVYGNMAVEV